MSYIDWEVYLSIMAGTEELADELLELWEEEL